VKPLDLAREITPDFPSSAGRPFRHPDEDLLARRDELASAARDLGTAEATELASRTWRLWMAARDVPGGRAFLAEVLDERQPPDPSRWRALALYGDGLFAFWAGDAGERVVATTRRLPSRRNSTTPRRCSMPTWA
jgi:hypothetical protein